MENFSYLKNTVNPKNLELILYPTEQCNFRCVYCYEDFSIGTMHPFVVQRVKKLIKKRILHLKNLKLSWFGGEPLIAKKVIFDLCEFSYKECINSGVSLTGGITTNGYALDMETAEKLANFNQSSYQISLDGEEKEHNSTRKLISGGGTFNKIWGNLIALKNSSLKFEILLRLHLNQKNISSMENLVKRIKENLLCDPRFSVFIKPIGNWGGVNDGSFPILTGEEKVEAIQRIKSVLADIDNLKNLTIRESSLYVCYASRPNSLAIRADGRIQKCTVSLDYESNNVGFLQEDGSVNLDQDKMELWMQGYQTGDIKALNCPVSIIRQSDKKIIPIKLIS